jgi:hypothetical protein
MFRLEIFLSGRFDLSNGPGDSGAAASGPTARGVAIARCEIVAAFRVKVLYRMYSQRMVIRVEQGKGRQGPLRHALSAAPDDSTHVLAAHSAEAMAVSRPRRRASARTQRIARRLPFSLRGGGLEPGGLVIDNRLNASVPTQRYSLHTESQARGKPSNP